MSHCENCGRPNGPGGTIFTHCLAHKPGDYYGQRVCAEQTIIRLREQVRVLWSLVLGDKL